MKLDSCFLKTMRYNLATVLGVGAAVLLSGCSRDIREGTIVTETYDEGMGSYVLRVKSNDMTYTMNVVDLKLNPRLCNLSKALEEGDNILYCHSDLLGINRFYSRRIGTVFAHEIKKIGKKQDSSEKR